MTVHYRGQASLHRVVRGSIAPAESRILMTQTIDTPHPVGRAAIDAATTVTSQPAEDEVKTVPSGSIWYIDGQYHSDDDARIPVTDLSVLRGYGVFDFLRTYHGEPVTLAHNIARLRRSAGHIWLAVPWDDDQINAIVRETLVRNLQRNAARSTGHDTAIDTAHDTAIEYNIRIVVTGGDSVDNITPSGQSRLLVMVTPLHRLPEWWYTQGVAVVTARVQRLYPQAKTINYIPAIIAQAQARQADAIEALYRTESGHVTEGTTTNLFAVYGDTLVTAEDGVLPGITRAAVLELARQADDDDKQAYTIQLRDIMYDELLQADEVFITAANKRIVPVIQIDGARISDAPGRHTREMMRRFDAYTRG